MRRNLTPVLLAVLMTTSAVATTIAPAWAYPSELPLQDKQLTPAEVALQRYKRQRLSLKVDGETWSVVQGINVTIPDAQLLQLAGLPARLQDQKQKETIGGAMILGGALIGVFGILTLTQVVPIPEGVYIGVGIGTLAAGIALAASGELFFPVMLPEDHYITVEEARGAIQVINERLKEELGVPQDTPGL